MSTLSRTRLVEQQFGAQASAYVQSAVHAKGPDLDRLADIVTGKKAARVLDLGCGGGHVSFTVARFVDVVVAYDLSSQMLEAVEREAAHRGIVNLSVQQGLAESLPFGDAGFDFVFTRFSAHHWTDLRQAVLEIKRVLKPGGLAVFMDVVTPTLPQLDTHLQAVEVLRDPSHVRDYSVAEWHAVVAGAGLVPANSVCRRLRLDFDSWVERIKTPALHVDAIRSLQARVSTDIARYFEIEADGSFTLDTMSLEAVC